MSKTTTISATPPRARDYANPMHLFKNLTQHKDLIWQYTRREILLRYRGTYLGWVWSIVNPLITLGVYTFVFGFILKARFAYSTGSGKIEYALSLFCGIVVYNLFSGCIARAPHLIVSKPNYVKKVVFPVEILPVAALVSNLVHTGTGFLILIPASILVTSHISGTIYLFPLILLPLCALTLGLGWFLSSMGVFARDIGQAITILLQLLFFMSAIIYPVSAIPELVRPYALLNPLIFIIENSRRTLIWGLQVEWYAWFAVTVLSFIIMQTGYVWFMKSKRSFSDLL